MKITTTALLFGSLIEISGDKYLEIGTGTGILSLMLAQRSQADILALEIDEDAAVTAQKNFQQSIWNKRLHCKNVDAIQWYPIENQKYDLIFSNPPFYIQHLENPDKKDTLARHDNQQLHQHLAPLSKKLLNPDGICWVLTDNSSRLVLNQHFQNQGFFPYQSIYLHHQEHKNSFAVIQAFIQKPVFHTTQKVIIFDSEGNYTTQYTSLLKDFLLFL